MKKKKMIFGIIGAVLITAIITGNILKAIAGNDATEVEVIKVSGDNITKIIEAPGILEEGKNKSVFLDVSYKVEKILVEKYQKVKKGQKLVRLDLSSIKTTYEEQVPDDSLQANNTAVPVLNNKQPTSLPVMPTPPAAPTESPTMPLVVSDTLVPESAEVKGIGLEKLQINKTASKSISSLPDGFDSEDYSYLTGSGNAGAYTNTTAAGYKTVTRTDKEAVKKKKKIQKNTKAPCSGIVSEINVTEGTTPGSMSASFVIINTDTMKVNATIEEMDIRKIEVGQKVTITGDTIDENSAVKGRVESIAPVAERLASASGEVTGINVVVDVYESKIDLIANANVTCAIEVEKRENVPVIDYLSTTEDMDGRQYVFVFDEETGTAAKREIEFGISSDLKLEVASGLSVGEYIFTEIQPSYSDGMLIKPVIIDDGGE